MSSGFSRSNVGYVLNQGVSSSIKREEVTNNTLTNFPLYDVSVSVNDSQP